MTIKDRRRALMGAQSDILWEWNPSKGTSNIGFTASNGETPNYEVLSDCIRLYGPSNSAQKWSAIATKQNLGYTDFTVEVYYKSLSRKADGSVGIIAATNGGGPSSGYFGYATYYANSTNNTYAVNIQLRGETSQILQDNNPVASAGVVKCHISNLTGTLNGSYPTGLPLSGTAGQTASLGFRICCVETNRRAYYADITRIIIRRGDTT